MAETLVLKARLTFSWSFNAVVPVWGLAFHWSTQKHMLLKRKKKSYNPRGLNTSHIRPDLCSHEVKWWWLWAWVLLMFDPKFTRGKKVIIVCRFVLSSVIIFILSAWLRLECMTAAEPAAWISCCHAWSSEFPPSRQSVNSPWPPDEECMNAIIYDVCGMDNL